MAVPERYPFQTLPDLLAPGLRLVFVGINPGTYSVERGHYFARRTNRFWPAFSRSRLSAPIRATLGRDALGPEADVRLPDFGIGFADVVKLPSGNAAALRPADFQAWAPRLLARLEAHRPGLACFHGLTAYRALLGYGLGESKPKAELGLQPRRLGAIPLFVVPNPRPGRCPLPPRGSDRLVLPVAGRPGRAARPWPAGQLRGQLRARCTMCVRSHNIGAPRRTVQIPTKGKLVPLPPLVGRQKEVLALPAEGHTVVLGTAGSGKTTLAVYRAAFLANPNTWRGGRTLLVTFNKTLVAYLRHLHDPRLPSLANVQVETYHKFALGYLAARGIRGRIICDTTNRPRLIAQCVNEVSAQCAGHPLMRRPAGFFEDELAWIAQQGFGSLQEYNDAYRVDRSNTRLARGEERAMVYQILRRYRQLREEAGYLCDYDDIASVVRQRLATDESPRMYTHVVIDEGQDFSPEMIRSLVAAVPSDGSVTFLGDMAQQIYGQRLSWRSAGLNVRDVWRFKENYRNTVQIARLALAIANMPYFSDTPDLVEPTSPKAEGPPPTLVRLPNRESEMQFVVQQAVPASRTRSVAILTRKREDAGRLARRLPSGTIRLRRDMASWSSGPGILVGTYHSAKGLEFDVVILPFLTNDALPDARVVAAVGLEEARAREGKLLYVAVTRARTQLLLTQSGALTELLPTQDGLYVEVTP